MRSLCFGTAVVAGSLPLASSFVPSSTGNQYTPAFVAGTKRPWNSQQQLSAAHQSDDVPLMEQLGKVAAAGALVTLMAFGPTNAAFAENELSDKYGGGLDTSLVDQTCLVDKCSLQAKACLADDPSCRKGLTCTAKCLGDNACITGCMARYGDQNLDNFLKCTIEDNECIKVAILPGGADPLGSEPRAPAPTVRNFDPRSLQGSWYKVLGYNPNYDCYACQRNVFSLPKDQAKHVLVANGNSKPSKLTLDVEFSMPHMHPDGASSPTTNIQELIKTEKDGAAYHAKNIGLNDYSTRETMVFDNIGGGGAQTPMESLVLNKGTENEQLYGRTAHSEGEMFGLKFWENWYVIGENEPGQEEFKFIYYNGKTRQNTYEGSFVYSRTKELSPGSMKRVYQIALDAGMNPDQFSKIRNGCFVDEPNPDAPAAKEREGLGSPSNPFRSIIASTRVSELLGVEPVAAREGTVRRIIPTAKELSPGQQESDRAWWYEVGDYLENPHRHFQAMQDLRIAVDWPEDVKETTQ